MAGRRSGGLELVVGGGEARERADEPSRDTPAEPSRARRFSIARDARLATLTDAAFAECLRHVLANREAAKSVDDPEGVHQLRVAVRRTRSAMRLFRPALDAERTKEIRAEVRWLAGHLSAARDWDVFVGETLQPIHDQLPDEPGLARLIELVEAERGAAHAEVRATLESERFERLTRMLSEYLKDGGWRPEPGSKRARRGKRRACAEAVRLLDRRLQRVQGLGRRVERLSARDLHRLRIRVKQLRYAGEFLGPLYAQKGAGKKRTRRYLKRLAVLQDELGHVNDGRVAARLVAQLLESAPASERPEVARATGVVVGWSHRGALTNRAEVRRAWKRLGKARVFWHE